jgi:hypothetical protein
MLVMRCRCDECASRINGDGIDIASVARPGITDLLPGQCIPFAYGRIVLITACEKVPAIGRPRE